MQNASRCSGIVASAGRDETIAICHPWRGGQRCCFCLSIVGVCPIVVLIEILLRGIQLTDTMTNLAQAVTTVKCLITGRLVGYSSGQRGQTVNLLAYASEGSNPSPTTTLKH